MTTFKIAVLAATLFAGSTAAYAAACCGCAGNGVDCLCETCVCECC